MRKGLFSLLFFTVLCFSLARCAALQKGSSVPSTHTNSQSLNEGQKVAEFAYRQIGTKYKYAGKDQKGFDCSGLVFFVMNEFGYALPGGSRTQEKYGRGLVPSETRAGDLIFFRRDKNGEIFHVAIVYSNDAEGLKVVHSTSSRGVVIDNISHNSYWKPKISTARRIF